jgi:hypothetical protein
LDATSLSWPAQPNSSAGLTSPRVLEEVVRLADRRAGTEFAFMHRRDAWGWNRAALLDQTHRKVLPHDDLDPIDGRSLAERVRGILS